VFQIPVFFTISIQDYNLLGRIQLCKCPGNHQTSERPCCDDTSWAIQHPTLSFQNLQKWL